MLVQHIRQLSVVAETDDSYTEHCECLRDADQSASSRAYAFALMTGLANPSTRKFSGSFQLFRGQHELV